jgi:yeast amino acid transporter
LFPVGGAAPNAEAFFGNYLSCPLILGLWIFWLLWSRDFTFFIRASDMDVTHGIRRGSVEAPVLTKKQNPAVRALRAFF